MPVRTRRTNRGFTLIEMMVSLLVMMTVSGAAFYVLSQSQKVYGSDELQADMHASLRSAFELITQELGQAGSLGFTPTTISAAVTANAAAQTVTLGSTSNMYVGEELTVDTGTNQEVVKIASFPGANQISGIFTLNHVASTTVAVFGVFPNGILTTSAGNTLQIFGNINADNTLEYVEYDCNPGTSSAPGTLTRSITVLSPAVTQQNASEVLLNNVVANPGGTSCFTPSMGIGGSVTTGNCDVGSNTFTCVTDMQIMLTVQSSNEDPQTKQFDTESKSFLNLSSRSIFSAYSIATSSSPTVTLLQLTPPGLPLPVS